MRISVSDPAGPDVATAADGVRRSRALTMGSPRCSIRCWSMIVTLAGVFTACSGARDAVTTIWLVSMIGTGMEILLLTTCRHRGMRRLAAAPAPRSAAGPGQGNGRLIKGRFLTSPVDTGFTVAGTAPDSHRLPFEPPPAGRSSNGAKAGGRHPDRRRAWRGPGGLSNWRAAHYAGRHDRQSRPPARHPDRHRRGGRPPFGAASAQFHADRRDGAV